MQNNEYWNRQIIYGDKITNRTQQSKEKQNKNISEEIHLTDQIQKTEPINQDYFQRTKNGKITQTPEVFNTTAATTSYSIINDIRKQNQTHNNLNQKRRITQYQTENTERSQTNDILQRDEKSYSAYKNSSFIAQQLNDSYIENLQFVELHDIKKVNSKNNLFNIQDNLIDEDYIPNQQKSINNIFQPNVSSIKQELKPGCKNLVRLQNMEFTYFCIKVRGQSSPLQIKINFEKPCSYYKMFISRQNEVPSNFSNDFTTKSQLIKLDSLDRISFNDQQHFFFSIVSSGEQILQIYYYFAYNKSHKINQIPNNNYYANEHLQSKQRSLSPNLQRRFQQQQEEILSKSKIHFINSKVRMFQQELLDMPTVYLKQEVKEIIKKRRKKYSQNCLAFNRAGFNILELNKKEVRQNSPQNRYSRMQMRHTIADQRQRFILKKKAEIDQFNTTSKEEGIWVRDIQKESRRQAQINDIKQFKRNALAFLWSTNIKLLLTVQNIQILYKKFKERKMLINQMAFKLLRVFQRYKIYIRKYNMSLNQRVQAQSQQSLKIIAKIIKRRTRKSAHRILLYLLQQSQEGSQLRNKMVKFFRIIYRVQMNYRTYNIKAQNYQLLLIDLWHKYFYMIMEQIIEIKYDNTLRHKKIIMRYNSEDVIENYVQRFIQERLKIYRKKLQDYLNYVRKLDEQSKKNIKLTEVFIQDEEESNELYKKILLGQSKKDKTISNYLSIQNKNAYELDSPTPMSKNMRDFNLAIKTDEEQQSEVIRLPRLYTIPTFMQIKEMIYQTIAWKNSEDKELSEIVHLKY